MNKQLRKKTVLAMDLLARQANDENVLESWLMVGVPDGEFKNYTEDEVSDYWLEKENYADLMALFIKIVSRMEKAGMYSDGVLSKRREI